MAKPPVIEDRQVEHLLKATAAYSRVPLRDTALLLTLYGTALSVTELATVTVGEGAGFIASVVGAIILLVVYGMIAKAGANRSS